MKRSILLIALVLNVSLGLAQDSINMELKTIELSHGRLAFNSTSILHRSTISSTLQMNETNLGIQLHHLQLNQESEQTIGINTTLSGQRTSHQLSIAGGGDVLAPKFQLGYFSTTKRSDSLSFLAGANLIFLSDQTIGLGQQVGWIRTAKTHTQIIRIFNSSNKEQYLAPNLLLAYLKEFNSKTLLQLHAVGGYTPQNDPLLKSQTQIGSGAWLRQSLGSQLQMNLSVSYNHAFEGISTSQARLSLVYKIKNQ
ncbi:MAG: hypothetical protein KTR13_03850 [Saprospiraceae bacterium]|nr:hypothetical protein [Saprospiraceae bacterium]